ncbi:hypothetical protein [Pontiella sp.]|uniref:hypothetical protein n=1 Tax=Pontiella sp. TaxID=2837462 RepID=UPI003569C2D3
MSKPNPPACPHCGSAKFISSIANRKVYLDHNGKRVPLLTTNFSLGHPVIEEEAWTLTCPCSWTGAKEECRGEKEA